MTGKRKLFISKKIEADYEVFIRWLYQYQNEYELESNEKKASKIFPENVADILWSDLNTITFYFSPTKAGHDRKQIFRICCELKKIYRKQIDSGDEIPDF